MAKALFITEQYVKNTTPINDNVDLKSLTNAILEAQEIHIIEAIGSGLYNDLAAKIVAGTLTGNDATLVNTYIRPTLKYWVLVEGIPMMLFKLTNKAVSTSTSANSSPVQETNIDYLVNRFKAKAELYQDRMIRYIQANPNLFPLFYNQTGGVDTIYPKNAIFTTDWYLGETDYTYKVGTHE